MSESLFAGLVTFAILVVLFSWVPAINIVCPPCGRALVRLRRRERGVVPAPSLVQEDRLIQRPTTR